MKIEKTMVIAVKDPCPMYPALSKRRHITAGKPVGVVMSHYYRARIRDGSLKYYTGEPICSPVSQAQPKPAQQPQPIAKPINTAVQPQPIETKPAPRPKPKKKSIQPEKVVKKLAKKKIVIPKKSTKKKARTKPKENKTKSGRE